VSNLGIDPLGVAVNPITNRIYVGNYGGSTVSVIDGGTNHVVTSIGVGQAPVGVAVNASTNRVYVANFGSNSVSVIDGSNNTVMATVAVGTQPYGLGVNPATNRVYVTGGAPNDTNGTVSVINDTDVAPTPRPDLAGKRIQASGDPAIYLVDDDGTRRHIPDPTTYNNLFRDWTGIQAIDVSTVTSGPELTSGAYLAWHGVAGDPVYFITNGQKRRIASPTVMDKFWFDSSKVRTVSQSTLDALPNGPDVT
jgi:YVTN family beta-propeller protein